MKNLRTIAVGIFVFALTVDAVAVEGTNVAADLNSRYKAVVEQCNQASVKSALYCSGILIKGVPIAETAPFWEHSDTSEKLGGDELIYLRKDLSTRNLEFAYGAVFTDLSSAEKNDKALEPLCTYPFALTTEIGWQHGGCNQPPSISFRNGSCEALGAVDASTWLQYFREQGNPPAPEQQCSLSVNDPGQFNASLIAHEGMGADWSSMPNEVIVKNWVDKRPSRLPLEAIFYVTTVENSLLEAQRGQAQYFEKTGLWLPVLALDLRATDGNIFTFVPQNQIDRGFAVADTLYHRYLDTATACGDGSAGFNCNGILIRGTAATPLYHAWDPSPGSIQRNAVSFSYLRIDAGKMGTFSTSGFIFSALGDNHEGNVAIRCIYPSEAGTSLLSAPCEDRGVCALMGLTTVSKFVAYYEAHDKELFCAFQPNQQEFQLSVDVRAGWQRRDGYNELLLAAWTERDPAKLPIEAFFYKTDYDGKDRFLREAQFYQRDYLKMTGHFMPILRFEHAAEDNLFFSYALEDQLAMQDVGPRAPQSSGRDRE